VTDRGGCSYSNTSMSLSNSCRSPPLCRVSLQKETCAQRKLNYQPGN
jgi:hypothetical protein